MKSYEKIGDMDYYSDNTMSFILEIHYHVLPYLNCLVSYFTVLVKSELSLVASFQRDIKTF